MREKRNHVLYAGPTWYLWICIYVFFGGRGVILIDEVTRRHFREEGEA